jgi:hypothetical protein
LQTTAKGTKIGNNLREALKTFALFFANLQTPLARSVIIKYTFAKHRLGSKTAYRFVKSPVLIQNERSEWQPSPTP